MLAPELSQHEGAQPALLDPCVTNPALCGGIGEPFDDGNHDPHLIFTIDKFVISTQEQSGGLLKTMTKTLNAEGNLESSQLIAVQEVPSTGMTSKTALAFNGTSSLLVYTELSGSSKTLKARLLNASGVPSSTAAVTLATGLTGEVDAQVAAQGSQFLVAWSNGYDVVGNVVDSTGNLRSARTRILASQAGLERNLDLVASGKGFALAYELNADVYVQNLAADGSLSGDALAVAKDPSLTETDPALVASRSGLKVAFLSRIGERHEVKLASVTSLGVSQSLVATGVELLGSPSIAQDCESLAVTFGKQTSSGWQVEGRLLDLNGALLDQGTFSTNARVGTGAALASDGASFMALWQGIVGSQYLYQGGIF
ncbi:MAG: hypothetical protein ACKO6N_08255 [Myxococcota bacterium]